MTWRDISTAPRDGTPILRPHVRWGAMAVKKPNSNAELILPKGCEWVTVDYATCWPETAFLPFWQPRPAPPVTTTEAERLEAMEGK